MINEIIQTFVNKINAKLWNEVLTDNFYYKVDHNRAILATLDSLLGHILIFSADYFIEIFEKLNVLQRSRQWYITTNI